MIICVINCRNVPKIIEALSVDGDSGKQIESSNVDPSSGAVSLRVTLRFGSNGTL